MSPPVPGSLPAGARVRYDAGPMRSSRYQRRRQLHRGASHVFHAWDTQLGREIALKTSASADPGPRGRLKREYAVLAEVRHPNIVEAFELHDEPDSAYFTMEYVRGEPVDLALARDRRPARVAHLFAQLAGALATLHSRNMIYRALKPSHVMVDDAGRVVLLDFRYAAARDERLSATDPGWPSETRHYVAPEALEGAAVIDQSSDWYMFGAMLYEALTGRPPFSAAAPDLVDIKRRSAYDRDPTLPADLTRLIDALLGPPAARPDHDAILDVLHAHTDQVPPFHRTAPSLVGRDAELRRLHDAYAHAEADTVLTLVHGESGIGKTALLEHFLASLPRRARWIIRARCHPSRHVNLHALDGIVEEIAQILRNTPRPQEMVPEEPVPELLRVFPALRQAPVFEAWPRAEHDPVDATLRRRAVACLREILGRMARVRPFVIWIDDVQWAGPDSAALLAELLHGQPLACLLILSFRGDDRGPGGLVQQLERDREIRARRVELRVGPLEHEACTRLVSSLLPAAGRDPAVLEQTLHEASGIPFLLIELCHVRAQGVESPSTADVVQWSLRHELPISVDLLKLLAVAGRPLKVGLARKILGARRIDEAAADLARGSHLLRPAASGHEAGTIEIYHDRIRQAILTRLAPHELQALHLQLAEAMKSEDSDDSYHILNHLRAAGQHARAAPYALLAAQKARDELAFERAAELFAAAIELGCEPKHDLHARRGESLADAGRGRDAGKAFLAAIAAAPGNPEVQRLRLRAAEEFLHSGAIEEGMKVLREALAHIGVQLPSSPISAMVDSLRYRVMVLAAGPRYRLTDDPEPPEIAARLDALWAASTSLSMVHHSVSDAVGVRHLVEALQSGHRSRVIRALGFEAAWEAAIGGRRLRARSIQMAGDALDLARAGDSEYDRGWANLSAGAAAWFRAEWRAAERHCRDARQHFRALRTRTRWESSCAGIYLHTALAHLGRLQALRSELTGAAVEALDRGDLFSANNIRVGAHTVAWLALDEPGRVLADADAAMATLPAEPFSSQHYYHTLSTVQAELYRGDDQAAASLLEAAWPKLQSAHFLRLGYIAAELWYLRGRVALAQLHHGRGTRKWVTRAIDTLRDGDLPVHAPFAAVLEACLARVEHAGTRAEAALVRASDAFAAEGMELHWASAQYTLEVLRGRPAASPEAQAYMTREGVVDPARLSQIFVPFGPLSRRT